MRSLITVLFSCILSITYSQNGLISIEGTIKDPNGHVVPFESIKKKWSARGTHSSRDGNFRLTDLQKGDTVVFSSVSYKAAYFVVNREYKRLDFIIRLDTLKAFLRTSDMKNSLLFHSGTLSNYQVDGLIKFKETTVPVPNILDTDRQQSFIKVEVEPVAYPGYPGFPDSVANAINKLKKSDRPQTKAVVSIYYWIRTDKKIEVIAVESPFSNPVNNVFTFFFESITHVSPAIQNGRQMNTLCVARFKAEINKDKKITLRMD